MVGGWERGRGGVYVGRGGGCVCDPALSKRLLGGVCACMSSALMYIHVYHVCVF